MAGIDEAGRGPLVGPLVFGGVAVPESALDGLAALGVKDSKDLSPNRREALNVSIRDLLEKVGGRFEILFFTPREIDAAVNNRKRKLSGLTEEAVAAIIAKLSPAKVWVDLAGPDGAAFARKIGRLLDGPAPHIIAEHKADSRYPIVSAASILAKVARDAAVRVIEAGLPDGLGPIGSGYPADPTTQAFLKRAQHLGDEIFRTSWKTYSAGEKG